MTVNIWKYLSLEEGEVDVARFTRYHHLVGHPGADDGRRAGNVSRWGRHTGLLSGWVGGRECRWGALGEDLIGSRVAMATDGSRAHKASRRLASELPWRLNFPTLQMSYQLLLSLKSAWWRHYFTWWQSLVSTPMYHSDFLPQTSFVNLPSWKSVTWRHYFTWLQTLLFTLSDNKVMETLLLFFQNTEAWFIAPSCSFLSQSSAHKTQQNNHFFKLTLNKSIQIFLHF